MQTSEAIHPDKSETTEMLSAFGTVGIIEEVTLVQDGVYQLRGRNANVALSFISDDIVRMKLYFGEKLDLRTTVGVLPQSTQPTSLQVEDSKDEVTFTTSTIKVIVTKASFTLHVTDLEGSPIYSQPSMSWNARGAITTYSAMDEQAHFYGLGEKSSFLDKRGERYEMWNSDIFAPHVPEIEALYESIPFLIHFNQGKVYGLFLDNPGKTIFDMRSQSTQYSIVNETGAMDCYIINGPTMKDVVKRYTDLTGRMSVPPKWSIGYHQSRYSYMSQDEVLELARTFRAKNIPCDVIYLDIHYMDEYRVFTFDKTRFPNPKAMMDELRSMGIRIVPIVDPGVKKDPKYPIYQEGIDNDYFCKKLEGDLFIGPVWPGQSAFPDFTEDKVAQWWGDKHKYYTELGIHGVWNDMNEPAVFNESKTMDLDVIHRNNGDRKTHEEIHNLYGMLMSKATYEGLKEQIEGARPFVLTRAGYSGIQRYAAVWTGDNRSFWEHMAMAMPMCLNLGLSGIPFTGPDIGGFAHHATGDLLARWMQMGVFFPYCRNHSVLDSVRQEPWSFGEQVEEICRTYIGLRYKWMPHLYNLFYEASQTGLPVMRPLILEYPQDPNVTNLCDQFLFGTHLLIAPIIRPDTDHRAVYLPEGVWYDYWTGHAYEGGQHILAHAPIDIMPIYVKAGSIVPEQSVKQYAEEAAEGILNLRVYGTGTKSDYSYTLYEDDGVSFAYEQGAYNLIQLDAQEEASQFILRYNYTHKEYVSEFEAWIVTVKHTAFVPQSVEGLEQLSLFQLADAAQGWTYDAERQEIIVKLIPTASSGVITIK